MLQKVDCDIPDGKKFIARIFAHYSVHFEKAQDIVLKYITDYKIGVAEVFSQYAVAASREAFDMAGQKTFINYYIVKCIFRFN